MMLRVLTPFLALAAACSTSGAPVAPAAPAAAPAPTPTAIAFAYDDADCNLGTVLRPGVPGSPGHLMVSDRNPNGDSELAVLMRGFVADLEAARLQVRAGGAPSPMFEHHRAMRCAWPTNPAERNAAYDQRAQAYLYAVRQFEATPNRDSYNAIVTNCVACHTASCAGVVPLIEQLRW